MDKEKVFRVHWEKMWKSLSKYISLAISIPLLLFMIIRFVSSGFSYSEAFEHVSPIGFSLSLLGACSFSATLALLIALWFRMASITIGDGVLQGRNYWGFKNKIPLHDIVSLYPFSNYGINAVIVTSRFHGKFYVSDHTERFDELIEFLTSYLPSEERENA